MIGGPYALEQMFVRPSGPGLEVLIVKESVAGARFRETFTHPDRDAKAAVRAVARRLVYFDDIDDVSRLRVREERAGQLQDAPALRAAFQASFDGARDEADDA